MWVLQPRSKWPVVRPFPDGVRPSHDASCDAASGSRGPALLTFHSYLHVTAGDHLTDGYRSGERGLVFVLFDCAVNILTWAPPPFSLGQCQFCEPTGLANMADIFHVNTVGQLLMSFDVSASKQALAFGDSGGCVHLWSDAPEVSFNDYSRETEFAVPCHVDTLPQLDWNHDLLPLSLIPMPLTSTEPLLSDWPAGLATPSPR